MKRIDKIHLKHPFMGTRMMADRLCLLGHAVKRKRVLRLMRLMGIESLAPGPHTSRPGTGVQHKVYPYLLRGREITGPDQAWCTDITYVPMEEGFMYLSAVMDWWSRAVLSWRLSNTMDVDFCVEALEEALDRTGRTPLIFNTDQGSQFTSEAFTGVLQAQGIAVSMDGRGRCLDNIFGGNQNVLELALHETRIAEITDPVTATRVRARSARNPAPSAPPIAASRNY